MRARFISLAAAGALAVTPAGAATAATGGSFSSGSLGPPAVAALSRPVQDRRRLASRCRPWRQWRMRPDPLGRCRARLFPQSRRGTSSPMPAPAPLPASPSAPSKTARARRSLSPKSGAEPPGACSPRPALPVLPIANWTVFRASLRLLASPSASSLAARALSSSRRNGTAPPGRSSPLPRQQAPADPNWRACRAAPPTTAPPSGLRAARSAASPSPRAGTALPGPSRPPSTHQEPPRLITTASLALCRAPRPQPAPLLDGSPRPSRTM